MMNADRSFLLAACRVVLGLILLLGGTATPVVAAASQGPRIVTPLLEGWRFHDGPLDAPTAVSAALDDRDWQLVSLPHSWNTLGEYGLKRSARTQDRQGEGWYRLTLNGARLPQRQRYFLQFDAVGNVADVWVNGTHVGHHAGAFSRFRFDVTRALHRRGTNVLAVRADNSRPAPGSTTQDVVPLQGDFFIHGGLYRPVSLISVGEAHIDLMDHGSPGIFVRIATLDDSMAVIDVKALLERGNRPGLAVRTRITDARGATVAQSVKEARDDVVEQSLAVRNPHRWDGRANPYLYRVTAELLDHHRIVDRVRQPLGIRVVRFDPARGFFLNGRHLSLHGVSRHQDYLGKGWRLTRADHERDMALIEDIGANTIRMAHYQHADDWFELADKAGMIAWAEMPFVNKLSFGDAPASPALVANAREQLIELIRQNYNHPSVVTWGIGNETDIDLAFGRLGRKADPTPLLDDLHRLARAEDPGRPTVIADCCEATPSVKVPSHPMIAGHADLMGYNRYFGWYYGKTGDLGPHLDLLHERHPAIPIAISEYGAGAALSQHSDNPQGGPINAGGRPHPEEYQAWFHEQSWPQIRARPFVWASWVWNMFDFSSAVRKEGDATDINDKGLVSFDRKVKKDAYYYYQAQWRDDIPVLHIAGRRYVDRAYPVTDVRIYSNLDRVSLILNGASVGRPTCADRVCVFHDVALRAGPNHLEARGARGGRRVTDAVDWTAPDARDGIAIKAGDLVGDIDGAGHRFGSDNWFVGGTAHAASGGQKPASAKAESSAALPSYRRGNFRYAIPLPNGRWRVTLTLVGVPDAGQLAPARVTAEGAEVLQVSALKPAETRQESFLVVVRAGTLDLSFGPDISLARIEVRPQEPRRAASTR